jgi:hypothetical protein
VMCANPQPKLLTSTKKAGLTRITTTLPHRILHLPQHLAAVLGNYDLLSGERMPPLLVAAGGAYPHKAVMAKNPDHLVGREPWRSAFTQPSPRRASRLQAT